MKAKRWLVGGIGILSFGVLHVALAAAPAPAPLVPDAARVARVTVLLTPSGMRYVQPMTYPRLLAGGCRFSTAFHPERQGELVRIMTRYLATSAEGGVHSGFVRNAIVLQLVDGAVLRYTFGDEEGAARSVPGWREREAGGPDSPDPGSTALTAPADFLRALRTWAAGDATRTSFDPECLRQPDVDAWKIIGAVARNNVFGAIPGSVPKSGHEFNCKDLDSAAWRRPMFSPCPLVGTDTDWKNEKGPSRAPCGDALTP